MTGSPGAPKSSTVPALSWLVCSATARGRAHRDDVPNQDAVAATEVELPGGVRLQVAAVADGHGGRRYVRSAYGSRCAVDLAVQTVAAACLREGPGADLGAVLRRQMRELVFTWRRDVLAHYEDHPFSAEEAARSGGADLRRDPVIAYGATLLVTIARGGEVALAQLGDGDALVRTHGSLPAHPVPGDDRLVAGETTSLCLPGAENDFRYATVGADDEVDLVVLATDGYGNSFAADDWWQSVVNDLAEMAATSGAAALAERLPGWLEESATIGGDDVTAAVLVRTPMAEPSAVPPAPPAAAEPAGSTSVTAPLPAVPRPAAAGPVSPAQPKAAAPMAAPASAPARATNRQLLIWSVAVVVVAVAAVVVFLVGHRSANPQPPQQQPPQSNAPHPSSTTTPNQKPVPVVTSGAPG